MSRETDQDRGPCHDSAGAGSPAADEKPKTDSYETLRETLDAILAGMSLTPEKLRS